jgi:O-6-methylguanine DNA methyltransferase
VDILSFCRLPSPLGEISAISSDSGLCGLEFQETDETTHAKTDLQHLFPDSELSERDHPLLQQTRQWLRQYFQAKFDQLGQIPLDLRGTAFQTRVWKQLLNIKLGKTISYGELATVLELPQGARAIGMAVGRNPVAVIVPCHRVLGQNGSLTGYGGGLHRKRWLLGHEGVIPMNLFSAV